MLNHLKMTHKSTVLIALFHMQLCLLYIFCVCMRFLDGLSAGASRLPENNDRMCIVVTSSWFHVMLFILYDMFISTKINSTKAVENNIEIRCLLLIFLVNSILYHVSVEWYSNNITFISCIDRQLSVFIGAYLLLFASFLKTELVHHLDTSHTVHWLLNRKINQSVLIENVINMHYNPSSDQSKHNSNQFILYYAHQCFIQEYDFTD